MGVFKEKACHISFAFYHELLALCIIFGKNVGKFKAELLSDLVQQVGNDAVVPPSSVPMQ